MKKNILNIILGVCISLVCLYFAFKDMDFADVWAKLGSVNYLYVLPVVLSVLASHYMRCYRWGKILETLTSYEQKTLFVLGSIGFMAVNTLPVRLGEFARPYLVKQRTGIKMSATMATIIVERVFDLLILMLLMFFVILKVPLEAKYIQMGLIVLTVAVSLFVLLIILAIKRDSSINKIDAVLTVFPEKISKPLNRLAHSFIDGLQILPDIGKTLYVFLLSILLWSFLALSAYILFLGFDFNLSVFHAYAILVVIAL